MTRKLDPMPLSATISRSQMMPSVREWFDAQVAKDESIAPCQIKGHPTFCRPCAEPSHTTYHSRWCGGGHAHYVKMSGLGQNIMTQARNKLRKERKAVELAA